MESERRQSLFRPQADGAEGPVGGFAALTLHLLKATERAVDGDQWTPMVDLMAFAEGVVEGVKLACYVDSAAMYWYSDIRGELIRVANSTKDESVVSHIVNASAAFASSEWKQVSGGVFIPFSDRFSCAGVMEFGRGDGFNATEQRELRLIVDVVLGRLQLAYGRMQTILASSWVVRTVRAQEFDASKMAMELVRRVREATNCKVVTLYHQHKDRPHVLTLVAQAGASDATEVKVKELDMTSVNGRVFASRRPRVIVDLCEEVIANPEIVEQERLVSAVVVPFEAGYVRGVLTSLSTRRRDFSQALVGYVSYLGAAYAAMAELGEQTVKISELQSGLSETCHNLRRPFAGIDSARAVIMWRVSLIRRLQVGNDGSADLESHLDAIQACCETQSEEVERGRLETEVILTGRQKRSLGRVKRVNVAETIAAICSAYDVEARKRPVRVVVKAGVSRLPWIEADEELVERIFQNLIENAIKYSWRDEDVTILGEHTDTTVSVTVMDNGLGIPESAMTDIFKRRHTSGARDVARDIPSSGLGLYIVDDAVAAHGGRVSAKSTPFLSDKRRLDRYEGFTTSITVVLPRLQPRSKGGTGL